jgi:hypothetical protein
MTSTPRRALLDAIEDVGACFPEMRLGQIILLLCTAAGETEPRDVYHVEDEELKTAALVLFSRHKERVSSGSTSAARTGTAD